jgi:hypothetical protein
MAPPRVLRAGSSEWSVGACTDASAAFEVATLGRSQKSQIWDLESGVAVASLEDARGDDCVSTLFVAG